MLGLYALQYLLVTILLGSLHLASWGLLALARKHSYDQTLRKVRIYQAWSIISLRAAR
jgi:hypothetical protein